MMVGFRGRPNVALLLSDDERRIWSGKCVVTEPLAHFLIVVASSFGAPTV